MIVETLVQRLESENSGYVYTGVLISMRRSMHACVFVGMGGFFIG